MRGLSGSIAGWLCKQEVIAEDEVELYEYAVFSAFLLIAPVILAIAVGAFFCPCIYRVVLVVPFMMIRRYGGGYHTKRLGSCLILSSALLSGCFTIAGSVIPGVAFHLVVLCSCVSICIVSPVDSMKRELSREDCKVFRKKTWIRVVGMIAIYGALIWLGKDQSAAYWGIGIILAGGLQVSYVKESQTQMT